MFVCSIRESRRVYMYVGFEVLKAVTMKSPFFWVATLYILERTQHFREMYHLHIQGSTLKVETVHSSEMSACLQTTRHYNP